MGVAFAAASTASTESRFATAARPAKPTVPEPTPDRDRARVEYQAGLALYRQGRYAEAMAAFERGHAITPLPGFVFNMALTARKLGQCARARDLYRQYLRVEPSAPNRAAVVRRMDEMAACARSSDAPSGRPSAATSHTSPTRVVREPWLPRPEVTTAPELGARRRWPPWVAAGASALVAASGVILWALAASDHAELSDSCAPACAPARWEGARAREYAGIGLTIAGGLSLGASLVWAYLWRGGDAERPRPIARRKEPEL